MKQPRPPKNKLGFLTEEQFSVLVERGLGHTQLETAGNLGTTRANVSMLEYRAKKNLEKARDTLKAYEATLSAHSVTIEKGTKIRDVPSIVLKEGDRFGVHLKTNILELIRLAKSLDQSFDRSGAASRDLTVVIMQNGKVTMS